MRDFFVKQVLSKNSRAVYVNKKPILNTINGSKLTKGFRIALKNFEITIIKSFLKIHERDPEAPNSKMVDL